MTERLRFGSSAARRMRQLHLSEREVYDVVEHPAEELHRSDGMHEYAGVTSRGDTLRVFLDRPGEPFLVSNIIVIRRAPS